MEQEAAKTETAAVKINKSQSIYEKKENNTTKITRHNITLNPNHNTQHRNKNETRENEGVRYSRIIRNKI